MDGLEFLFGVLGNAGIEILVNGRPYNQIPAVLFGCKDLTEPNWQELLYGKIDRTHRQAFDPMRCTPEPVEK